MTSDRIEPPIAPTAPRLHGKVAIVVGAGQTAGDTLGNGRATALLFAAHGAHLLLVDRRLESAEETARLLGDIEGRVETCEADITREDDCRTVAARAVDLFGRIDVLHHNVGIGGGDAGPTHLTAEAWDRIHDTNLKAAFLTAKHVLPTMRAQEAGSLIFISSVAAVCAVGLVAYKTSKAGLNALSHSIAMGNCRYGIRSNVIMPGLIETPMAIEGISRARGVPKEELIQQRDQRVPLRQRMGSAWDVAYAALFLASDEAKFVTGIELAVDGGQSARIG